MEVGGREIDLAFWIKFAIIYVFLVIVPLFFLNFTGGIQLSHKIIGMFLGAGAVYLGMIGKSLRKRR